MFAASKQKSDPENGTRNDKSCLIYEFLRLIPAAH